MWIEASEKCSNEDGKLAIISDLGYDMFLFSKMFGKGWKSQLFSKDKPPIFLFGKLVFCISD